MPKAEQRQEALLQMQKAALTALIINGAQLLTFTGMTEKEHIMTATVSFLK